MYQNRLIDRLAALAGRAARALEDRRGRRALARELADLEHGHLLDATLADMHVARSQVPALLRGFPQRQRLFHRMLARLGVSPAQLTDRDARNDLMWRCTTCQVDKTCRRWLDAGRTRGYEAFCPNAGAFKRLVATAWPRPR
jgi:hypothetical protein